MQIEDVKKKTRRLLRKIIETTQSLSEQSDDVFITVLLKWNADTPRDYEPSGFMPAKYMFNLHKTDQYEAKVGSVKTNFHAVATKIRYVSGYLKKLAQKLGFQNSETPTSKENYVITAHSRAQVSSF